VPESRNLIGWLLLGLLGAVGAGGAILGVTQAPGAASLQMAITNTLQASSYSESFVEYIDRASQSGVVVYQAPDRFGGYVNVGKGRRTYLYVVGDKEYQSVTVPSSQSTAHLTFYVEQSQTPVSEIDLAQRYLRYERLAHQTHRSGTSYSFSLTQGGQTGTLSYVVSGQYVSKFTIASQGDYVDVNISQVDAAPSVGLPKGSRVVAAPPASSSAG